MKQTLFYILILSAAMMLGTSCGGDDLPEPQDNSSQQAAGSERPSIDQQSISYNEALKVISFKATCPLGTRVAVLFRQLTNGNEEKELNAEYNSSSRQYFVQLPRLVGGSQYTYCVLGFDINGNEVVRTPEQSFSTPKDEAPEAPSLIGITAYAPTTPGAGDGCIRGLSITTAMEYSTDNGRTWNHIIKPGIIENLLPGDVLLRLAETPTTQASKHATINVPPYRSNTDLDGTDGTSEGLYRRR